MGKQRVEQCRAKGHLRIVRFYSKVILGPSFCSVFWTPVYSFTPAPNSGTVREKTILENRLRFLADLKAVYDSEGDKDPEEFLSVLASPFNEWRSQSVHRMRQYLS